MEDRAFLESLMIEHAYKEESYQNELNKYTDKMRALIEHEREAREAIELHLNCNIMRKYIKYNENRKG